jgi:2-polyprenyl-3-methyl-5-hydroxy-6-metoxy-1,4-benzoquinol methylase
MDTHLQAKIIQPEHAIEVRMETHNYFEIAALEEHNWWYKARRDLLNRLLKRYALSAQYALDAGCGVGSNLAVLQAHARNVCGIDISKDAIELCSKKGYAELRHVSINQFVSNRTYGIITCLDVLEHIENDGEAVKALSGLLQKDGLLIVSVPAHAALWNDNDDFSHHRRRYSRAGLVKMFSVPGLEILKVNYWNQLLFFPALIFYGIQRRRAQKKIQNNLKLIPPFFNALLLFCLEIENKFFLICPFITGVSIVLIARKTQTPRCSDDEPDAEYKTVLGVPEDTIGI